MKGPEAKEKVISIMFNYLVMIQHDLAEDYECKTARDCRMIVNQLRRHAKRLGDELQELGTDIGLPYVQFINHKGKRGREAVYQ